MSADIWLTLLGRDTLLLSAGVIAAQCLRPLLWQLGGATVLAWRWAMPLLFALAGHLPQWLPATTLVLPPQVIHSWSGPAPGQSFPGLVADVLLSLWLTGLLLSAAAHWRGHRRFVRQLAHGEGGSWSAPAGSNPALLGLWRGRLVLPADFEQRFEPDEQTLILAHENAHGWRRDNLVNLLALLVCVLHWFNPLLWWACARLRQDQELACDALVLRRPDADWRPYVRALLKVQGQAPGSPLVAAWRPTHPLIERIEMLKQSQKGASAPAWMAARGLLLVLGLGAASLVMALRAEPAQAPQSASAQKIFKAKEVCQTFVRPELPNPAEHAAPKGMSKLQATFTVGPDGKIGQINIAGDAFFQPAIRDAIEHYGCAATGQTRHAAQEFMFKLE